MLGRALRSFTKTTPQADSYSPDTPLEGRNIELVECAFGFDAGGVVGGSGEFSSGAWFSRPRSPGAGGLVVGGGRSAAVVFQVGKKIRLPGLVVYFLPLGEVPNHCPRRNRSETQVADARLQIGRAWDFQFVALVKSRGMDMDSSGFRPYLDAWLLHTLAGAPEGKNELKALLDCCSPDMVYEDVPTAKVFEGHDGIRRMCEGAHNWSPDVEAAVLTRQTNELLFAVESEWRGTNTASIGDLPATGRRFALRIYRPGPSTITDL